jgi:hypothetical protein
MYKSTIARFKLLISQKEHAKECFKCSRDIRIPRVVMELAAKLQLNSKEKFSVDELVTRNPIVNKFILVSRWKDQIVDNPSIPSDSNLGELSTHWWRRFNDTTTTIPSIITSTPTPPTTSSIASHCQSPAIMVVPEEACQRTLPTIVVAPDHRCQLT